jgi:hypothetical protein
MAPSFERNLNQQSCDETIATTEINYSRLGQPWPFFGYREDGSSAPQWGWWQSDLSLAAGS